MTEFIERLIVFLQSTGFYQMFANFTNDTVVYSEILGYDVTIAAGWKTFGSKQCG